MSEKPFSGSAFPKVGQSNGLTKREYFAGQALAGCVIDMRYIEETAKECVAAADALIAELAKEQEE